MHLQSKLFSLLSYLTVILSHQRMSVMEFMDHGSLFDLLHNDTLLMEGDLVLPILRDIAQGLRFLHAGAYFSSRDTPMLLFVQIAHIYIPPATPQVIHGDLKAANVLVDSKFR